MIAVAVVPNKAFVAAASTPEKQRKRQLGRALYARPEGRGLTAQTIKVAAAKDLPVGRTSMPNNLRSKPSDPRDP
jgi:hypothetical protein